MAKEGLEHDEEGLEGESFFTKKRLIIGGAIVLLLAVIGAGAYLFVFNKPSTGDELASNPSEDVKAVPIDGSSEESNVFEFDSFIVNILNDGVTHYLKMEVAFEMGSPRTKNSITKEIHRIKDAIILLTSSKTFDEVCDLNGKLQLKQDIKDLVNGILAKEGHISKVYFTDFVIQ